MASKKTEPALGCGGTTCSDSTCLACQVAAATNHHAEVTAIGQALVAGLSDIAKEMTLLRNALVDASAFSRTAAAAGPRATAPAAQPSPPKASAPTPAPAKPAAAPAPETKLTIDTVRPKVLEWIKGHGRDAFVAILVKYGAAKLPDVKDADLAKLLADLDAADVA